MKFIKYLIFIFTFSPLVMAQQSIQSDSLKLGRPNTNNKTLTFEINQGAANPKIRANGSTQKIEFANDGVNYKGIGSGSGGGGGINALLDSNFDFEAGTTSWTNSGGTFTTSNTPALNGSASGLWSSSASGQTLRSALIAIPAAFIGRSCQVDGLYRFPSGNAGSLVWEVLDGSDNVLAQADVVVTSGSDVRTISFPQFTCPTSGSFRFGLRSTGASGVTVRIDDIFLGSGRNTISISQADLIASAQTSPSSTAAQTTSATYVDMTYNSTRVDVLQGRATAAAGNLVGITIASLSPGKYEVFANFSFQITSQTTTTNCLAQIHDGTDFGGTAAPAYTVREASDTNQNGKDNNVATSVFNYASAQSTRTFKMQAFRASGNGTCNIATVQWIVKYYPLNANNAVTFETSGWNVSGTIFADELTVSLGTGNVSSYTGLSSSSGVLVANSGSAPVQITCSSTNAPTGTTCSTGNEQIGIAYDIPDAGLYEACFDFSYFQNLGANTAAFPNFRLYDTNPSDDSDVSKPLGTGFVQGNAAGTVGFTSGSNISLCRDILYSTVGKKAVRVKYTQAVTGTPTSSIVQTCAIGGCGGGASFGQRGVEFRIKKKNQQSPSPVFTDLQNSLKERVRITGATSQPVVLSAFIQNNGVTCGASGLIGSNFVSSISRTAPGVCAINLVAGTFPLSASTCVATSTQSTVPHTIISNLTQTAIGVTTQNTSHANTDGNYFLQCVGY